MNITDFLEARIVEDEKATRPATVIISGGWPAPEVPNCVGPEGKGCTARWGIPPHNDAERHWWKSSDVQEAIASHEMTHATTQQRRMLAECAAKRAITAHSYWKPEERPTDAELHLRSRHPAYEYETTEGQRKSWDDADKPPEGEGWERNVDAGRDGWDRFDFHEESYWRRLKPESERKEWKQWIPNDLRAIAAVYKDHPDYDPDWAL